MYNTVSIELPEKIMKEYKKFARSYVLQFNEDEKLKVTSGAALTLTQS